MVILVHFYDSMYTPSTKYIRSALPLLFTLCDFVEIGKYNYKNYFNTIKSLVGQAEESQRDGSRVEKALSPKV